MNPLTAGTIGFFAGAASIVMFGWGAVWLSERSSRKVRINSKPAQPPPHRPYRVVRPPETTPERNKMRDDFDQIVSRETWHQEGGE